MLLAQVSRCYKLLCTVCLLVGIERVRAFVARTESICVRKALFICLSKALCYQPKREALPSSGRPVLSPQRAVKRGKRKLGARAVATATRRSREEGAEGPLSHKVDSLA